MLYFVRDPLIWIISGSVEASFFVFCAAKILYWKVTKQTIMLIRLSPLAHHSGDKTEQREDEALEE